MRAAVAGALLAVIALAACGSLPQPTPPASPSPTPVATTGSPTPSPTPTVTGSPLAVVDDPGHVTGTLTGPCHAQGQLPDPACTPGAILPEVTQATIQTTICVRGWTATVRPPASETSPFKYNEAYPAYGIPAGTISELDHLVPLELGGASDARNLWPELGTIPNAKDKTEGDLRAAVCAGRVTLAAAQLAIATNWTTAEKVLGIANTP